MALHATKQAICCCADSQCAHYKRGDLDIMISARITSLSRLWIAQCNTTAVQIHCLSPKYHRTEMLVCVRAHSSSKLACSIFTGDVIPRRFNFCWSCKFSASRWILCKCMHNKTSICTHMWDPKQQHTWTITAFINTVTEIKFRRIWLRHTNWNYTSWEISHSTAKMP